MTTISVHMEASESRGHHTFDLEDLNLTQEEWEAMPDNEKGDAIQRAVDDLQSQPYWIFTHLAD